MAKKKRVLVLVPVAMDEKGLAKRRTQQNSVELGPDIEFDYRAVKTGPTLYDSYHDFALADVAMFEAGISAEDDGYDAVCIDTVSDSGMNALRSVLDIPVIAPGKASYLMCLLLATRFGILTQWPRWDIMYRKTLQEYGLADKCVGIRSPGLAPDPINLLGGKEEVVFPQFLKCGQELVEMGAEAICLGSTTMHEAHEFLSQELPVPIINPGPLTYKLAETVLGMGLSHSRLAYPPPSFLKLNMTHAMMDGGAAYDGED